MPCKSIFYQLPAKVHTFHFHSSESLLCPSAPSPHCPTLLSFTQVRIITSSPSQTEEERMITTTAPATTWRSCSRSSTRRTLSERSSVTTEGEILLPMNHFHYSTLIHSFRKRTEDQDSRITSQDVVDRDHDLLESEVSGCDQPISHLCNSVLFVIQVIWRLFWYKLSDRI